MLKPNPHAETTPYVEAMYSAIVQLKEQGWNSFRIEDVANLMGRKPTGSLRARLREAADTGLLKPFRYYTDRGGLATAYWIDEQQPLPGMEQAPW